MVRLPRPLVLASSAVTPPSDSILMTTSGEVAMRLWRRIAPLCSVERVTCGFSVVTFDSRVVGAAGRSRSSALGKPPAPTNSAGQDAPSSAGGS